MNDRANLIWYSSTAGMVSEWILNTSGTTQATFAVSNAPSGYVPVGMGDVEGDGISDIVLYNSTINKVAIWFLDSEGHYRTNLLVNGGLPMTSGWMLRAIGDIDQDGRTDLIWHHSVSRLVAYWILNVDGTLMTYGLCTNTPMSAGWSLNASGDIDGDGTVDLLWHNSSTRRVAYWFMNPDGTLRQAGFCSTNTMAAGWEMKGAGTIGSYGELGILWHNANTKKVAYWMLGTNGLLATSGFCTDATMSGGWEIKAVRDINMDGTADIVWFNTTTRRAAYWLLNNDGTLDSSGFCADAVVSAGYNIYGAGVCQPTSAPGAYAWVEVAGLPTNSIGAGAGALGSYVYYIGGLGGGAMTNVYRYNGTSWSEVAGLPGPRWAHSVCAYDGNLYAMGGYNALDQLQSNVFRYNGTSWSEVTGLPYEGSGGASAVLHERLYLMGGYDAVGVRTNVLAYNGASWTEVAGLPGERYAMGAATLGDYLYVAGGVLSDYLTAVTNVYRFDGTNWTEVAGLPVVLRNHTLTARDGALYAAGGLSGTVRTNVYKYMGGSWTEVAGLPEPRRGAAAAAVGGYLYVMGGEDSGASTNVYRYGPATNPPPIPGTWTEVAGVPLAVYSATVALYSNMVYYMGGYNLEGLYSNVYAFNGTSWSEVASLPPHGVRTGKRLAGMAAAYSNKLYYVGGMDTGSTCTNTLSWYDNTTWTASDESKKLPQNIAYGNVLVYSNRLYSIGGWNNGTMVTNVYWFNETEWVEGVGLPTQRAGGGATVYKGCIYYVGGIVDADPATNVYRFNGTAWTEVSGLPTCRYYNATVTLGEYIYTMGGADQTTSYTNMYRFDGTSWTEVNGLPYAPYCHVTFVYSNTMYVAGGNDWGVYVTNCYRYNSEVITADAQEDSGILPGEDSLPDDEQTLVSTFEAEPAAGGAEWIAADAGPDVPGDPSDFVAGGSLPSAPLPSDNRANLIWYSSTAGMVSEWILNTSGTTQATFAVSNAPSGYVPAGMGDVEGDGVSDIVLYNSTINKVAVWFLDSEGRYRTNLLVNGGLPMTSGWMLRAIGDIDTDGRADLVWHHSVSRMVAYWILNVDGSLMTYGLCTNTPMSAGWSLNASGDIDNDGTVDLLWHNSSTRRVAYWLLNPDGTLREAGYCSTNTMAAGWEMKGAGTIGSYGELGILWHNANTKKVAYWMLGTNGLLATSGFCTDATMSGGWEIKAVRDINMDGTADIVWFNTTTRRAAYWLLNNDGTLDSSGFCADAVVSAGYNIYGAGVCQPTPPIPPEPWTEVAGVPLAVYSAAGVVYNGLAYYLGGYNLEGLHSNVYAFNGTSWSEVQSLPPHGVHTGNRLAGMAVTYSNKLYFAGGMDTGSTCTNTLSWYDGSTWTASDESKKLPQNIAYGNVVVYSNRLYSLGGWNNGVMITNVYWFNETEWVEGVGLPTQRAGGGATVYKGCIYYVGGIVDAYPATNVYKFNGTAWTEVSGLPTCRYYNATVTLGEYVYSVGGADQTTSWTNIYRFDGTSWTEVTGLPYTPYCHVAFVYSNSMYVAGGNDWGNYVTNCYRYNEGWIAGDAPGDSEDGWGAQ